MENSSDAELVRQCLQGNQTAWADFYTQNLPVVRETVRRHARFLAGDMDDTTQNVFCAVVSSLESYDSSYSLSSFVGMIAKRTCVDEYRRMRAGKRDGGTDPIDHHDCAEWGTHALPSSAEAQDEELARIELLYILHRAVDDLDSRCRSLLRMRYYEDLPYKKITELTGVAQNTLVVQVRRCIKELQDAWRQLTNERIQR